MKTLAINHKSFFANRKDKVYADFNDLIHRPNIRINQGYNGVVRRYKYPVLTRHHIPINWRYDLNPNTNPYFQERLEVNSVFNAGALYKDGKFLVIPRIESSDVKSFFAVAESDNGVDNFKFRDYPIVMPTNDDPETNVYDIRLTEHEDGWIYGTFCAERKDLLQPHDSSAAIASNGLARTKDLINWERLPDIMSNSPQQRNCVLHPEFVNGKYAFYTRPMDGFIALGHDGGIGWGVCDDVTYPALESESIMDPRKYHTIKEVKNGLGPQPLKTDKGWLQLAHGVRRTAAGLRYVLYLFLTDLHQPWKIVKYPGRHFLAPIDNERVGDVNNVLFSNGWIRTPKDEVFIYYASSDTRTHVATTSIDLLLDYVFNTPQDMETSSRCVSQRIEFIEKNYEYLIRNG